MPSIRTTIGTLIFNSRAALHHAGGQRVAAQDAAENIDQHCLHIRIGKQNAECVLDLFGVGAATDIQEIRRTAAGELDDVHGGHRQAGAVHHAGDVAIELDVVQAELGRFHFERIFFVEIAQVDQVLVPEHGVVVEVDLGIQRDDFAILGQDQRIDLGERRIECLVCLCQRHHEAAAAFTLAAGMPMPNASLRA